MMCYTGHIGYRRQQFMINHKVISVSITPELHRLIKNQCAKDNVTISGVIQEKLTEYIVDARRREEDSDGK